MAKQTVENINRLAPFMEDYTRKLLESAYQRVQTGETVPNIEVAKLTPEQIQAGELAQQGLGSFQPFLDQAEQLTQQGVGILSDPTAYQQFMSPYTQDVIDNVQKDIERNRQIQAQNIAGNAVSQGAFGGSRERIAQTELARNAASQFADTAAKLREAGYQTALNQQQRVAEGLGQFGGQMANLGITGQQAGQQDIANLLGIGSLYQQQAQNVADATRATQLQQQYEPYQRLGFFSDILRGVPTTQSSVQVGTSPGQSPFSQIAGAAATGLGLAGQLGYQPFAPQNTMQSPFVSF